MLRKANQTVTCACRLEPSEQDTVATGVTVTGSDVDGAASMWLTNIIVQGGGGLTRGLHLDHSQASAYVEGMLLPLPRLFHGQLP